MESNTATKEKKAEAHVIAYIASFNDADLDAIKESLDASLQILVDGAVVASGRESVLPSYSKDFEKNKKVRIIRNPMGRVNGNTVTVEIGLKAEELQDDGSLSNTTLDVRYIYDILTMKQIRHEISNIVVVN